MISKNQTTLIGTVGKDPEVIHYPNGTVIAKLSLATNEKYKKDGKDVEKTTWHNVRAWGYFAELIERDVKTGTVLCIDGKNANDTWEDKSGKKHYEYYVQINQFGILAKQESRNGSNDYMSRM